MAQIAVRFNSQQMYFPLLSQQCGRTIIGSQNDLTYVPGLSPDSRATDTPVDRGVPMVYYAHNVMPTVYGMQSVALKEEVISAAIGTFYGDIFSVTGAKCNSVLSGGSTIWTLTGAQLTNINNFDFDTESENRPTTSGQRSYIARVDVGSGVLNLAYVQQNGQWALVPNSPNLTANQDISVADVNGYTYIWVPTIGPCIFDCDSGKIAVRDWNGISVEGVRGVAASNGYTLTYSRTNLAWSSSVDVEDFVPSDVSGAGGGSIQEAKGDIVCARATQLGLKLFTKGNMVAAYYTGNDSYPFEIQDIPGSDGVLYEKMVSNGEIRNAHFAYTASGIQTVTTNSAKTSNVIMSDFIDQSVYEDYNESTEVFTTQELTADMTHALEVVAGRYIVLSYGPQSFGNSYTHAIIFDTVLNRMGKIKVPHVKPMIYNPILIGTYLDTKGNIGFLQSNGRMVRVDLALGATTSSGVLLFGKVQAAHNTMLTLDETHIENVRGTLSIQDHASLDGKTTYAKRDGYAFAEDATKLLRRYFFDNTALSHSLLLKGNFEIVSLVLMFKMAGRL
jgi:hypothetical protein